MMHGIVESMICAVSAGELWNRIFGYWWVLDVRRRHQQDGLEVQRLPRTGAGQRVDVCDVGVVHCSDVSLIAGLRLEADVPRGQDEGECGQDASIDAS